MAKNYYAILGVLPTASGEDIKGAYRRRAKELHPDHYGKNGSPFLEVQEAYGVLSDPTYRHNYDLSLQKSRAYSDPTNPSEAEPLRPNRSRVENLRSPGIPVNMGEIYPENSFQTICPSIEEILDRLWRNYSTIAPYKSEGLHNLCIVITLTPDEIQCNGRMEIILPFQTSRPTSGCQGVIGLYQCF